MDKLQRIVEEKIQQAFEEGAFDNLPGKGEPLKLDDENPFEDPASRMGYRLLRNNGFTLPWIQEQKEIIEAEERLRAELARAWQRAERTRATGGDRRQAELRWRKAATAFRQHVADLNERIRHYNAHAPLDRFHRRALDAERELARVAQPLTLAEMELPEVAAPTDPPAQGTRRRRSLLRCVQTCWRKLTAWLTHATLRRNSTGALAATCN